MSQDTDPPDSSWALSAEKIINEAKLDKKRPVALSVYVCEPVIQLLEVWTKGEQARDQKKADPFFANDLNHPENNWQLMLEEFQTATKNLPAMETKTFVNLSHRQINEFGQNILEILKKEKERTGIPTNIERNANYQLYSSLRGAFEEQGGLEDLELPERFKELGKN